MLSQDMLANDVNETSNQNENNEDENVGGKIADEQVCNSNSNSSSTNVEGDGAGVFRVKAVSEINGHLHRNTNGIDEDVVTTATITYNASVATTSSGVKRKLPDWMLHSVTDSQTTNTTKGDTDAADTSSGSSKKSKVTESEVHTNEPAVDTGGGGGDDEEQPEMGVNAGTLGEDAVNDVDDAAGVAEIKSEPIEAQADTATVRTDGADNEDDNDAACSSSSNTKPRFDIKPAVKIEKADASSTSRESCRFGIRCYRRNPMHRIEEAHPGDHDYKRPNYPTPPLGTPACPFGNSCYRRNPAHFEQYSHPPDTDFDRNYRMRLRKRQQRQQQQQQQNNTNGIDDDDDTDLDDYDLEDPFIDDGDLDEDYVPSNDEDDDDDEEEEPIPAADDDGDYDDCDKAEE